MEGKDLSLYRLAQAEECLKDAKALIAINGYKGATNRAYYCVLHSMRSLLALDSVKCKSHGGVMADFKREYINTGIIEREMDQIITESFKGRINSDYKDFFIVEKTEAVRQVEKAGRFHERVKDYLYNERLGILKGKEESHPDKPASRLDEIRKRHEAIKAAPVVEAPDKSIRREHDRTIR